MITRMEVFSAQPSAPELPLGGTTASQDPIQIRDVDGLGPVKAEITTTQVAVGDGELYTGATVGKRNIVLTLGLNPNWVDQTMSSLRQLLYRYFLPKAWVKLRFFSDYLPEVDIEGYVESVEPNIFSQDPEVQVSVICPRPDFIQAEAVVLLGVTESGLHTYDFEYDGTVPTGIEFRLDRTVDNVAYTGDVMVQVEHADLQVFTANGIAIDTTKFFKMSSVLSRKRVSSVAYADSAVTNLLSKMTADSVWPQIISGANTFGVNVAEADLAWTLAYFNRFGGL